MGVVLEFSKIRQRKPSKSLSRETLFEKIKYANPEDLLKEMNGDRSLSDRAKINIADLACELEEDRNLSKQFGLNHANPNTSRIKYIAYLYITNRLTIEDLYHEPSD